jgi:uncharacterized protein YjbI with pentapeptide repeats
VIALCLRSFRIFYCYNIIKMKYFIAIIACFVAFSMNSQVDRILVNGSQAHATLNLLELESIIETLQAQVAALQTAQSSAFDGTYGSLTGAPTIPSNMSDLTNDAGFTTFDGDYVSLTNPPTIPSNVSDLTNDAGYTTFDGAYGNLTGAPTLATVATSGSYTDLSNQLTQKDIVESAHFFPGADLSGAILYGASLSNAYLYEANLQDADLSGADLSGARLIGANLQGADLYGANLSGADLSNANLSDADLTYADRTGVTWTGAWIGGCTGCVCPDGDYDYYCD